MGDPYSLERFVEAQAQAHDGYEAAVSELRRGRKVGHWIWYIFPQVQGLGYSYKSRKFAISSLAEARAYLQHPVLGPRLIACAQAMITISGKSTIQILGDVDAIKLRSSMTLFMEAAPDEGTF